MNHTAKCDLAVHEEWLVAQIQLTRKAAAENDDRAADARLNRLEMDLQFTQERLAAAGVSRAERKRLVANSSGHEKVSE